MKNHDLKNVIVESSTLARYYCVCGTEGVATMASSLAKPGVPGREAIYARATKNHRMHAVRSRMAEEKSAGKYLTPTEIRERYSELNRDVRERMASADDIARSLRVGGAREELGIHRGLIAATTISENSIVSMEKPSRLIPSGPVVLKAEEEIRVLVAKDEEDAALLKELYPTLLAPAQVFYPEDRRRVAGRRCTALFVSEFFPKNHEVVSRLHGAMTMTAGGNSFPIVLPASDYKEW